MRFAATFLALAATVGLVAAQQKCDAQKYVNPRLMLPFNFTAPSATFTLSSCPVQTPKTTNFKTTH